MNFDGVVAIAAALFSGGLAISVLVRKVAATGMGDLTTVDHQDLVRLDRYLRSRPAPIHQIPHCRARKSVINC